MPVYPELLAGQRLTGTRLRAMVANVTDKLTATDRFSNVTPSLDPELTGISLTPGRYLIKTILSHTGVGGIRVAWDFTGTQLGGNRRSFGQAIAGSAAATMNNRSVAITAEQLFPHDSASAYANVEEEGIMIVTVTGNFGIKWAQNTTNAAATSLKIGSYVEIKQIAA